MNGRPFRVAAGVITLIYVAIQGFQEYVFRSFAPAANAAEELMQGGAPLHVARSTLMLVAMFGLIFLYWVICAQRLRRHPILAVAAFLGFFLFGSLEVMLRSVELFWLQIQLPADYASATDPAVRTAILGQAATFGSVQRALYFPLMFGPWLGSIALFFLFPGTPRIHWALKGILAINVIRMTLRLLHYAEIELMSMSFYNDIYLPLVLIQKLPLAYWLLRVRDDQLA